MAGNDKKAPGRCWKLARTLVLALTLPVAAVAKPKVAETCTLWKDTKCHRFFYRRQTDFTKYTRVAVLPLDYDTLSISQSAKKKLRNNWSEFGQRDMPDTARFFDETCTEEQEGRTHFSRTEPGDANVLIVAYPFNEVTPRAYIDNSLSTLGDEELKRVCSVQQQVAIYDGKSREVVGMIENDLAVLVTSTGRERVLNNRANLISAAPDGNRWKIWQRTCLRMCAGYRKNSPRQARKCEPGAGVARLRFRGPVFGFLCPTRAAP